ncbi:hypothetical protein GCM10009789_42060 [Kribbella sancticallisti]|uniref:Uncharacterized protein n=1 Tax=Kribbella sancticallisti TaxID=460087 RepID=A0ABN2DTB1_9ACTN
MVGMSAGRLVGWSAGRLVGWSAYQASESRQCSGIDNGQVSLKYESALTRPVTYRPSSDELWAPVRPGRAKPALRGPTGAAATW